MSDRMVWWRDLLRRQAQSELTIRAFCDREGVSTASYYSWRRRLAERGEEVPAFVPVNVAQPERPSSVEIVYSDAVTIRVPEGTARETIVDVLAAVEAAL